VRNHIQKLREKLNLTQDELARRVEVTRQTINAIENDKYNPTLLLAFKLARLFDLTVDQVFDYDAEMGKGK